MYICEMEYTIPIYKNIKQQRNKILRKDKRKIFCVVRNSDNATLLMFRCNVYTYFGFSLYIMKILFVPQKNMTSVTKYIIIIFCLHLVDASCRLKN